MEIGIFRGYILFCEQFCKLLPENLESRNFTFINQTQNLHFFSLVINKFNNTQLQYDNIVYLGTLNNLNGVEGYRRRNGNFSRVFVLILVDAELFFFLNFNSFHIQQGSQIIKLDALYV